MKKNLILFSIFILTKFAFAENAPFLQSSYTNQLQTNNPGFYGLSLIPNKQTFEIAVQSLYSSNYQNIDYQSLPIFYSGSQIGCIGYYDTRSRKNLNSQRLNINIRNPINKHFQIGCGIAINRNRIDPNANATSINIGNSLIYENNKGAYFSFGINLKIDHYLYQFTNRENQTNLFEEQTQNIDLGIAYLSQNKTFQLGIALFNLKEKTIGQYDSDGFAGFAGGSSRWYQLNYFKLYNINMTKRNQISRNGKMHLNTSINTIASWYNGFSPESLLISLELSKTIKNSQNINFGIVNQNIFTNEGLLGPTLKYKTNYFEISYVYLNIVQNQYFSNSAIHNLGLKLLKF
ncbi:MAG: hypothetical protein IT245_08590 [Bacteroidia bacterium]|nr:hypothetical protein [Bacteroidia bacterium]